MFHKGQVDHFQDVMLIIDDGLSLRRTPTPRVLAKEALADHVGRLARGALETAEECRAAILPKRGGLASDMVPIPVAVSSWRITSMGPVGRVIPSRGRHHLPKGAVVLGDWGCFEGGDGLRPLRRFDELGWRRV